jgi:hypothetical protein
MKFILILFFINSLFATEYLMPQNILKKALSDQENTFQKPHLCHELDKTKEVKYLPSSQGFLAKINCEYQCVNLETNSLLIQENFQTSDFSLERGDGNLWAGLALTLELWSNKLCIDNISKRCGGLDKIKNFSRPKIKSGNWLFEQKLSCQKSSLPIVSPFDSSVQLDKISPQAVQHVLPVSGLKPKKLSHDFVEFAPPKNCKKLIKGTFCFGDCVALDSGPMKELLSGPEPLGSDTYSICADQLISNFKDKKLSKDVKQYLCEDYFISALKDMNAGGFSCAAARIDIDCSHL